MKRPKTDLMEARGFEEGGRKKMNVRITEAARQVGVHPNTLRRLEKRGVIVARRDWVGHRFFSPEELKKIEKILFNGRMGNDQGDR